jgi:Spy/CpxP family protein refolding chaperone
MKTSLKVLFAALSLAVCAAVPLAQAADATAKKERAAKAANDRLEQLTTQLSLTDDQKPKVEAILNDEQQAVANLRKDKTLTPEARKEKQKELSDASKEKIRALLTPEQAAKLDSHGKGKGKAKAKTAS